jgi:ornithine cyclodeaminase/alanine dehydrogenase-like protein (mu-crystallin family)
MSTDEAEDAAFLETDLLVVDNWQTLKGWEFFAPTRLVNEGKLNGDEIVDLGEIIIGKKKGRRTREDSIIFANLGMGCLDITIAERIYKNAKAKGLGQKLKLWEKPLWL